jgi:hypothetical protein
MIERSLAGFDLGERLAPMQSIRPLDRPAGSKSEFAQPCSTRAFMSE